MGAVTPLGVGARTLHERWASGVLGIADGAGAGDEVEPKDHLSIKEIRRLDRFSQLALVAAGGGRAPGGRGGGDPRAPPRGGGGGPARGGSPVAAGTHR